MNGERFEAKTKESRYHYIEIVKVYKYIYQTLKNISIIE